VINYDMPQSADILDKFRFFLIEFSQGLMLFLYLNSFNTNLSSNTLGHASESLDGCLQLYR
jgi:hypothetical protein